MSALEKAESVAKIVSLIALPLVVAVGGWRIQSSMNENAVKSQYVEIAVSVLNQSPEGSNVTLRDWASKTLAEHSSIDFSKKEIEALVTGEIRISDYKSTILKQELLERIAQEADKLKLRIKTRREEIENLSDEERARVMAEYHEIFLEMANNSAVIRNLMEEK